MQQLLIGSLVLVLCALVWGSNGFGQEVPSPQGELQIVDKSGATFACIVFSVFEHLVEKDGPLVPRLGLAGDGGSTTAPWRSHSAGE